MALINDPVGVRVSHCVTVLVPTKTHPSPFNPPVLLTRLQQHDNGLTLTALFLFHISLCLDYQAVFYLRGC